MHYFLTTFLHNTKNWAAVILLKYFLVNFIVEPKF